MARKLRETWLNEPRIFTRTRSAPRMRAPAAAKRPPHEENNRDRTRGDPGRITATTHGEIAHGADRAPPQHARDARAARLRGAVDRVRATALERRVDRRRLLPGRHV